MIRIIALSLLLIFLSSLTSQCQPTDQRAVLQAPLSVIIDSMAKVNGYQVIFKTALSPDTLVVNTPRVCDVEKYLRNCSTLDQFALYIKDGVITIYPSYEYIVHNRPDRSQAPSIRFYDDSIRQCQTLVFFNAPIGRLLDSLAKGFNSKLNYHDFHLPPVTASGYIPLKMGRNTAIRILGNAHRFEQVTAAPGIHLTTVHVLVEEAITYYALDPERPRRHAGSARVFFDTLNNYWALRFNHMRPEALLDTLRRYNKTLPIVANLAAENVGTASGVLPLHPHPLVLLEILKRKHRLWYYERKGIYHLRKGGAGMEEEDDPRFPYYAP